MKTSLFLEYGITRRLVTGIDFGTCFKLNSWGPLVLAFELLPYFLAFPSAGTAACLGSFSYGLAFILVLPA